MWMRRSSALIDHRVIRDAADRDLPGRLTQSTMNRMLTALLGLSPREAARRARAAEHLGDRVSMLGEPLAVAEATSRGTTTPRGETLGEARACHTASSTGWI